ncbi:hypothetical protein DPEC_G00042590 [Dallia pectoralis]|uniref:Uncharacterized protein n=1 Tax=Dallia pectoralis TaxID=75939 RepID=A0ACC2H954_DALPE|nr:hypothetical protein DPEC_G00042590 [Dallia pectoralis]
MQNTLEGTQRLKCKHGTTAPRDGSGSWGSKMNQTAGVSHQVKCQSTASTKAMAKVIEEHFHPRADVC